MLYLNIARNKEDFILNGEEKYPKFIKKILCFFRKFTGQVLEVEIEGKNIVVISKINKKTYKKLDKIFKIDVTKNICISEYFYENKEFLNYLKSKNLNIINGRWLFKYLVFYISKFICNKLNLNSEMQEISLLVNEPNFLVVDTIKKLSNEFKNINIITTQIRKFEKLEKELFDENGSILNVTNNFKKACLKSKIVFNYDLEDRIFSKIVLMPTAIIISLDKDIEIKQSNFKGKIIDFYSINLPGKYKKIYDKLNTFNSSILYESFIYKKTSHQNIWNEIENDNIEILLLENNNRVVTFNN